MKFMSITKRFGFVMVTVLAAFQLLFVGENTALGLSDKPIMRLGKMNITGNVVFSPDGKYLAIGASMGEPPVYGIALLDASNLGMIRFFEGHTESVTSVAFSPDSQTLASGASDTTIKLWDVKTTAEIATLKGHTEGVESIDFSPNGKILASGSDDTTIKLWNVQTAEVIATLRGHTGDVEAIAFSPDGRTLASGGGGFGESTIRLWNVQTAEEIVTLRGHSLSVYAIAFSPDGQTLASGSDDSKIKLWDVHDVHVPTEIATLIHGDTVFSVAFGPDGKNLASGGFGSWANTKLWDVQTREEIATLEGQKYVHSVAFSPDGLTLASGSSSLKLWDMHDVRAPAEIATLKGDTKEVQSVAFSPDGEMLASGHQGDDIIKLWNVRPATEIKTLKHGKSVNSVAFSSDGKMLASGGDRVDQTIKLWDVETTAEIAALEGHTEDVESVAFSPDGLMLASGSKDTTIRLWDVIQGTDIATLEGHAGWVNAVAFSPDGQTLASGSGDTTIKLWDMRDVENISEITTLEGHAFGVTFIVFSPDGRTLASGSLDKTIRLWDLATGTEIANLEGHADWVYTIAFSPDGQTLASGSKDKTIKLWNVAQGTEIATLRGHTGTVASVAFSPDGNTLASGSIDQTILIWDAGVATRGNTAPLLSNGSVTPQTGHGIAEFTFKVVYAYEDNDMPFSITVKIDDDASKPMMPVAAEDTNYTDGKEYEYKTTLGAGEHRYTFAARDWMQGATGDIAMHLGPTVTEMSVPGPSPIPTVSPVVHKVPQFSEPIAVADNPDIIETLSVLAVDKEGNAHIAYMGTLASPISPQGVVTDVFYTNNVGGSFSVPVRVETPTGFYSKDLSIAVDNSGTAHIAYRRSENQVVLMREDDIFYVNNAGGGFGKPQLLVDGGPSANHSRVAPANSSIAVDGAGNVHIAYNTDGIYYMNNVSGNFSEPIKVSGETRNTSHPMLKIGTYGNVHIVYQAHRPSTDPDSSDAEIYYINNVGGSFTVPVNISNDPEVYQWRPTMAIDSNGYVHIAYEHKTTHEGRIYYVNNIRGDFGAPVEVVKNNEPSRPSLDVDSHGNVHIAYATIGAWSLSYATNVNGDFARTEVVAVAGALREIVKPALSSWFAVDGSNRLHFTYYYTGVTPQGIPTGGDIYYVTGKSVAVPDVTFTDVATEAGVGNLDAEASVSFGDYNNDGYPDIYVANNGPNRLYRNNGDGTFTDVAVEAGVEGEIGTWSHSYCAVWGDYDNDGKRDLFLGHFGGFKDDLYRNNGDGTFTLAYSFPNLDAKVASWVDYNDDGLLDLFAIDGFSDYKLYRNDGNNSFSDVTEAAGFSGRRGSGQAAAWGDYDNDNDMDLCVDTDKGVALFQNNGDGTFTDVTEQANITGEHDGWDTTADWGDYDNDGWLDLLVNGIYNGDGFLYHNNGNGTFTEVLHREKGMIVANVLNMKSFRRSGDVAFLDYDNDGALDIFLESMGGNDNSLYLNNGNGTFLDVSQFTKLASRLSGYNVTVGDYDLDGDLDIYPATSDRGIWPKMNVLYRNNGNENKWLHIRTVGTRSNRDGIGARVKVITGTVSQIKEVSGGRGKSQDSLLVEFGLGAYTQADIVEILWPSGIVQTLKNVPANQLLTVIEEETEHPWDVNRDGVVDILDLVLIGKHFGESPPKDAGVDVNEDGKVDILDLVLVAQHFGEETTPQAAPPSIVISEHSAHVKISKIRKLPDGALKADIEVASEKGLLYGFQFDLAFGPQVVTVVDISEGSFLKTSDVQTYWRMPNIDNQSGKITGAAAIRLGVKDGASDEGVLASVIFKLKDTASIPFIDLNLKDIKLVDSGGKLIPASVLGMKQSLEALVVPKSSALLPNYPNPFNPETWIPYQLSEESDVTISIYNITGQLVQTLELGDKTAGFYIGRQRAAYWDGRNDTGERVASGVYFYQLQAGEFSAMRKLVVLK